MATIYDPTDMTDKVYQNFIYRRPENKSNEANKDMIEWLDKTFDEAKDKDIYNVNW